MVLWSEEDIEWTWNKYYKWRNKNKSWFLVQGVGEKYKFLAASKYLKMKQSKGQKDQK